MNLNLFPKDLLVELDAAGQPYTTTLAVAQAFNKSHRHVLRDVKNLVEALGEISIATLDEIAAENHYLASADHQPKFGLMIYMDKAGKGASRKQIMYRLHRDAFMLLTMRYTGKKALETQVRFMTAFNAMEELLSERYASYENAFRTLRPRLSIVAENPDLPRTELQQLTGHKSPSSITASRKRCRELGLLH